MAVMKMLSCRRVAIVAAVGLSAGCAVLQGPEGGGGTATIVLRPQVIESPYRLQAVVAPYTGSSIEHVAIKVFTVADGTESVVPGAGQDIARSALSQTVTIGGLLQDTAYRIRAYAFKAAGTAPADQISVDASSSVDVTVAGDDHPPIAALPIRLADQVFSGQATGSLAITDGIMETPGTETAVFGTPAPTPTPTHTPTPLPRP